MQYPPRPMEEAPLADVHALLALLPYVDGSPFRLRFVVTIALRCRHALATWERRLGPAPPAAELMLLDFLRVAIARRLAPAAI